MSRTTETRPNSNMSESINDTLSEYSSAHSGIADIASASVVNMHSGHPESPVPSSRYRVLPPSNLNKNKGSPHQPHRIRRTHNPHSPGQTSATNTPKLTPPHPDPPGYPGLSDWLDIQPILLEEGQVVDSNLDISDASIESIVETPPSPEDIACISVADLRHAYGQEIVALFRKIQRLDFQGKKTILDKRYLAQCIEHGIYPKWLNIRIGSPGDRSQDKLITDFKVQTLKNEIAIKKRKTQSCFILRHKLTSEFRNRVSKNTADKWLDSILSSNTSRLERVGLVHFRKFTRLLIDNHKISAGFLAQGAGNSGDPFDEGSLNVIFNQSSHVLSPLEEEGLRNGLKFILTPNKLDEVDLYSRLESLVGTIYYVEKNPPELADIASELSREAQNAIERFNHNKPTPNIRKSVLQALKGLANNKDLVITKPDKGNGVVLMDRTDYVSKIMGILSDPTKFQANPMLDLYKPTLNLENEVTALLKELLNKNIINIRQYTAVRPSGSRPCLLYGLPKIHKVGTPLRPILSASGSAVHGLAQIMVPILAPITTNQYTVSNSLVFAEEMANLDKEGLTFASYDVASLFTNIPLDETEDIIIEANEKGNLTRDLDPTLIRNIIKTTTKNCFFRFDGKTYKQTDGVAMGSPLGPTLANIFMADFESKHLDNCPESCRPVLYRRYVDDILLAFRRPEDIQEFWAYYNNLHPNIKFSIEEESGGVINFLDICIKKEGGTSTFRKNTFTGLLTKYNSFIHQQYKTGLISCLLYRAWKLCSNEENFQEEISFLKKLFLQNRFPLDLFIEETNKFKAKHCSTVPPSEPTEVTDSPNSTVVQDPDDPVLPAETAPPTEEEKGPLTIALPFFGDASLRLRNGVKKSLKKHLPDNRFRFVFKSGNPLASMFKFKDQLDNDLCSKLVYQFSCSTCHVDYIGCTIRHLRTRVSEHMGISALTGQPRGIHPSNATAVRQHTTGTGHPISPEDFKIIYNPAQGVPLKIAETILIQRNKPGLNDTVGSYPLRVHPTNLGLEAHLLARNPSLGFNASFNSASSNIGGTRTGGNAIQRTRATPKTPPNVYNSAKRIMPRCTDIVRRAQGFPSLTMTDAGAGVSSATTIPTTPCSLATTSTTRVSARDIPMSTGTTPAGGSIDIHSSGGSPSIHPRGVAAGTPIGVASSPGNATSIGTDLPSSIVKVSDPNTYVSPHIGASSDATGTLTDEASSSRLPSLHTTSLVGATANTGSGKRPTPYLPPVPSVRGSFRRPPSYGRTHHVPPPDNRVRDWSTVRAQGAGNPSAGVNPQPSDILATPTLPRGSLRRDCSTVRRSTRIASLKGAR